MLPTPQENTVSLSLNKEMVKRNPFFHSSKIFSIVFLFPVSASGKMSCIDGGFTETGYAWKDQFI